MKLLMIVPLLLLSAPAFAEETEATEPNETHLFAFVDHVKEDDELLDLRDEWRDIVKRKDTEALLNLMSEDVYLSYGQNKHMDRETQKKFLDLLEDPDDSAVWVELDKILRLGSVVNEDKDKILMPWIYAYDRPEHDWTRRIAKDEDRDLKYELFVSLRETPLFKTSAEDSPVIRMIKPYETLLIVFDPDDGCEAYRTHDGLQGCVNPEHVRSLLDYRARFEKRSGEWKLVVFIAGD